MEADKPRGEFVFHHLLPRRKRQKVDDRFRETFERLNREALARRTEIARRSL